MSDFESQDFCHPSRVHFLAIRLPGVSSQAPQPPANIWQPSGLRAKGRAAPNYEMNLSIVKGRGWNDVFWHLRCGNLNFIDRSLRKLVNPEGCQKLAGGRSRTKTPGKTSRNRNAPRRGARNLTCPFSPRASKRPYPTRRAVP